uniref:GDSL esterase/lipase n=1 Tax=Aegilops tauschii subsp. strangulata TaxID=200361 RepID=A0A453M6J9_AEGTS
MAGASVFACCSLFIMALMAAAAVAGSVPALYVFGDSLVDVGNNNHLLTPIKADFTHNGMDYPGRKATGRFSNGKNSADFLGALPTHSSLEQSNTILPLPAACILISQLQ